MAEVCVVHLVWAPLGREPVERFATAYGARDSGLDHRLLAVLNGFEDEARARHATAPLTAFEHDALVLEEPVQDLAAYRAALDAGDEPHIVFLNSFSEPLVDGWLAKLVAHARREEVGMAGATGSYESAYSEAPRPLKPLRRLHFPPAPNPHIRSNAFAMARALARDLRWPAPRTKLQALRLESGRDGLTRQVLGLGLGAVVVGRDDVAHPPERWAQSATFRSGAQENLLVADNRTRQYAEADPAERRRLAAFAWGRTPG